MVGTGQSLAVGTLPTNPLVNQQPFENLMLSLGGLSTQPPYDPAAPGLAVVPLVEPLRALQTGFPAPYPGNLWGETPHGAMASQISALAEPVLAQPYVTLHSVVGESGQGMLALRKGASPATTGNPLIGRAYAATLFEVEAATRLAAALGASYGVGAIVVTHGETDAGNSEYGAELMQLWADYNQDLRSITGQAEPIPLVVSQHHAYPFSAGQRSEPSASTLAQWRVSVDRPGDILCSGPKYQYPYIDDGIHLQVQGYEMLGEKYGQVYFEHVVLGRDWRPLEPVAASASGNVISVRFHVPVPPLAWDESLPAPHQNTEWANGRGFEVRSGETPLVIDAVQIEGDVVSITLASAPPAGSVVAYAMTSDGSSNIGRGHRSGQLRDSDPFVGQVTGVAQPNYAVAFEVPVP